MDSLKRARAAVIAVGLAFCAVWAHSAGAAAQYCASPIVAGGDIAWSGGCFCGFTDIYRMTCDGVVSFNGEGYCHIATFTTGTCTSWQEDQCRDRQIQCSNANISMTCADSFCAPSYESCDGSSNNGGGRSDGGACGPDDCQSLNTRTDPVHVGSGAYLTHPYVDVLFEGSSVPIEFVREFTSMDRWLPPQVRARERARLGQGWFHTYDQALYASNARDAPNPSGASGTVYVHRAARGNGRPFTCDGDPLAGGICRSSDGSLDSLRWDSTGSFWELWAGSGTRTRFDTDGELLGHGWYVGYPSGSLRAGWTVHRFTSGSLDGYIDYVQGYPAGRRLYFRWDTVEGRPMLARLESGGTVLATFTRHAGTHSVLLETADSAAGMETYGYPTVTIDGRNIILPYLTSIQRDGVVTLSVTYDNGPSSVAGGWCRSRPRTATTASATKGRLTTPAPAPATPP